MDLYYFPYNPPAREEIYRESCTARQVQSIIGPGVRMIIVWSITIIIRTPPARERMIQVVKKNH